jgi:hypothetical protein
MKRIPILFISLVALTGCTAAIPAKQETVEKKSAAVQYAGSNGDCRAQAESKLKLFDRPDTYPISDQERNNARTALFSECMKAHEPQVAGTPKSDTQQANAQDAAALATLSPAAGEKPPAPANAAVTYPSGSTVIMVQGSEVSSLNPAAGGNPQQSGATGPYPPGATVVVVQAPAVAAPPARPAASLPAPLARPVAVPAQNPAASSKTLPVAATNPDTQELEQVLTK